MMLSTSGVLQINNLTGTGNRLLQTDNYGNIIPFPMGSTSQVLYGNGTWGSLPTPPTGFWNTAYGGDIYYNGGKVGIGTNSPIVQLDVIGDARISNNLYVGGGIIITDKVNANAEVLTGAMRADSIILDSTKGVYGIAKFRDEVRLENKLSVMGNAVFSGTATVNGDLKTMGNITFGGSKTLSYSAASGSAPEAFGWGTPVSVIGPILALPYCLAPTPPTVNIVPGMNYFWGNNTNGGQLNVMSTGFDGANGIIDVTGTSNGQEPRLLLNYYCGRDVLMCTGSGGNVEMCNGASPGTVKMANGPLGGTVFIGNTGHTMLGNVNIGNTTAHGTAKVNVDNISNIYSIGLRVYNQFINSISANGIGIQSEVSNELNKAFTSGTNDGTTGYKENFVVFGDGYVMARDIRVTLDPIFHADYVFENDYKLMPLSELEMFLKLNKHLPNVPNREDVKKNKGISLGEMSTKQLEKIEELTLYILELNKKLEHLSETVAEQQSQIKTLQNK